MKKKYLLLISLVIIFIIGIFGFSLLFKPIFSIKVSSVWYGGSSSLLFCLFENGYYIYWSPHGYRFHFVSSNLLPYISRYLNNIKNNIPSPGIYNTGNVIYDGPFYLITYHGKNESYLYKIQNLLFFLDTNIRAKEDYGTLPDTIKSFFTIYEYLVFQYPNDFKRKFK